MKDSQAVRNILQMQALLYQSLSLFRPHTRLSDIYYQLNILFVNSLSSWKPKYCSLDVNQTINRFRLTQWVPLVDQELLTLHDRLFGEVRVTLSLVLCVCFVDRCLSFCTFSFGHYVVWSSSINGFWLLLWYLQTLLMRNST